MMGPGPPSKLVPWAPHYLKAALQSAVDSYTVACEDDDTVQNVLEVTLCVSVNIHNIWLYVGKHITHIMTDMVVNYVLKS